MGEKSEKKGEGFARLLARDKALREALAEGRMVWDETEGVLKGEEMAPIALRRVRFLRILWLWAYVPGSDAGGEAGEWKFNDRDARTDLASAMNIAKWAWKAQRERVAWEENRACPFMAGMEIPCREERCAWWVKEPGDGGEPGCAFEVAARNAVLIAGVLPDPDAPKRWKN